MDAPGVDVEKLVVEVASAVARELAPLICREAARAAMIAFEQKQAEADARLYGWKNIAADVSAIRGTETPIKTLLMWTKRRRFPVDKTIHGEVSAVRWEIHRWLRAVGYRERAEVLPRAGTPTKTRPGKTYPRA